MQIHLSSALLVMAVQSAPSDSCDVGMWEDTSWDGYKNILKPILKYFSLYQTIMSLNNNLSKQH